jgi:hypothetical protein
VPFLEVHVKFQVVQSHCENWKNIEVHVKFQVVQSQHLVKFPYKLIGTDIAKIWKHGKST